MVHRPPHLLTLAFVLAATAACDDTPLFPKENAAPTAIAGPDQKLDYTGEPVTVQLDGRKSSDPNGTITKYIWMSGTSEPDAGVARVGPDPMDVAQPSVMLDQGAWKFVLWVVDDGGKTSRPSTVTITVGSGVPPEAVACVGSVPPTALPAACAMCACTTDDTCRAAIMGCSDTANCWELNACVAQKCAGITDMAAIQSCVTGMCADLLGGGLMLQKIAPCLQKCAECSAAPDAGM
jgi:hypothetical protein